MGEVERAAAEAEVARRSRVMAGLDETDGAPLEAAIVEAIRKLRSPAADADEDAAGAGMPEQRPT